MALLMAVANDAPTPPHAIDAAIPRGLSDVVLRCLAKRPEQRFADYAALAAALAPYGIGGTDAGHRRAALLAGAIDNVIIGTVSRPCPLVMLYRWWRPLAAAALDPDPRTAAGARTTGDGGPVVALAGQGACRLTVVDTRGRPCARARLDPRRAVPGRTGSPSGRRMTGCRRTRWCRCASARPWRLVYTTASTRVFLGIVFVAARRRNGYAALHDLATGTRVVAARDRPAPAHPHVDAAPTGRPGDRAPRCVRRPRRHDRRSRRLAARLRRAAPSTGLGPRAAARHAADPAAPRRDVPAHAPPLAGRSP